MRFLALSSQGVQNQGGKIFVSTSPGKNSFAQAEKICLLRLGEYKSSDTGKYMSLHSEGS